MERPFHFIHSIAANGNIGLSGQAQWLPVAVDARDCAPKSPTVSGNHATNRVKRVSAPKGPAHQVSYLIYWSRGRVQHTCCVTEGCPCRDYEKQEVCRHQKVCMFHGPSCHPGVR